MSLPRAYREVLILPKRKQRRPVDPLKWVVYACAFLGWVWVALELIK